MSTDIDTDTLPVVEGVVAGFGAWIVGYVLTYILEGTRLRESDMNRFIEFFEGDPATYELVGWAFYNAHFVDIVYDGFAAGGLPANYIGGDDGLTSLLYVIPPLILFAAGLAIARYHGTADRNQGAVVGVLVVPGYLVLAVVGAVLFEISAAGTTGHPDYLLSVVLAGIIYPAVFGAAGGVVGSLTAE